MIHCWGQPAQHRAGPSRRVHRCQQWSYGNHVGIDLSTWILVQPARPFPFLLLLFYSWRPTACYHFRQRISPQPAPELFRQRGHRFPLSFLTEFGVESHPSPYIAITNPTPMAGRPPVAERIAERLARPTPPLTLSTSGLNISTTSVIPFERARNASSLESTEG